MRKFNKYFWSILTSQSANLLSLLSFSTLSPSLSRAEVIWHPLPSEAYNLGKVYPEAQNLLFAFDYGHALVYERLLLNKGLILDPEKFEKELLQDIFKILKNPPTVKVDEGDIAPNYVYAFPKIVSLFDWSHLLHQFVLDVLVSTDDRGPETRRRISEINRMYQANKPLRITDQCKTMLFMDGHYFSKSFRRSYPSFNLLIWSYHWFQIHLYDDLMKSSKSARDRAVKATLKEFWRLISNLPDSAEFDMMPETTAVAPEFSRLFPRIAASFDNNHMLHDIVSDILTSSKVENARAEGAKMAEMVMDPEAFKSTNCKMK